MDLVEHFSNDHNESNHSKKRKKEKKRTHSYKILFRNNILNQFNAITNSVQFAEIFNQHEKYSQILMKQGQLINKLKTIILI